MEISKCFEIHLTLTFIDYFEEYSLSSLAILLFSKNLSISIH